MLGTLFINVNCIINYAVVTLDIGALSTTGDPNAAAEDTVTRTLTVESLNYVQGYRISHHGPLAEVPAAGALSIVVGSIVCQETFVPAM